MTRYFFLVGIGVLLIRVNGFAAPTLSLVSDDGLASSSGVANSSDVLTLQLQLDTDGIDVSALEFSIGTSASTASQILYGSTPVSALSNPFTSGDVASAPQPGSTVDSTNLTTFTKGSEGDYPAFSRQSIAVFQFDISSLAIGQQYTLTPIGSEIGGADSQTSIFAPPNAFTLTVVPEPSTAALFAVAGGLLAFRRRMQSVVA